MIAVDVTPEDIEWARGKKEKHVKGKRFDQAINTKDSVLIGYIGEKVFQNEYPLYEHCDTSDCDFKCGAAKIDCKTYVSKFQPRPNYFLQIPEIDMDRSPDMYVFICLLENLEKAFMIGWINRENFIERSVKRVAGTRRQSWPYVVYTANCYEITIQQLDGEFDTSDRN